MYFIYVHIIYAGSIKKDSQPSLEKVKFDLHSFKVWSFTANLATYGLLPGNTILAVYYISTVLK